MGDRSIQQRLAAVLAADVVGYTRLMEKDTEGTVAAWQAVRDDVINPTVDAHSGRIVKLTGDGFLAEFPTVHEAVKCGLEMQQGFAESTLDFRIGINLGDIIDDGQDIHGEGVNVAARIEALADPGGICISGSVHVQVRNRIEASYEDLGEKEVKNVSAPVRVYRVGGPQKETEVRAEAPVLALPDKPSIAVLPLTNMSGDPEQEYFADGITEDVITDLSKVSGLFVIARNSSFAYKDQNPDVRQVCRDLGVRYVLEGSVRKAGGRVRINSQLIDGSTGGHLWAERYDRNLEDIFAVQDEVTREIVDALKVALTTGERTRREGRGKVNPEAYDCLVRARTCIYQFSAEAMIESRAMLERAIALDPGFAPAYALLSLVHCMEYANGWNDAGPDHLTSALELAHKARAADEHEPQAYLVLALTQMWLRNLEDAERAGERAIELDPNFAQAFTALGAVRDYAGRHESAIALLQQALRLDPKFDLAIHFLGRAQFSLARYDDAEASFKRRLIHVPQSDMTRVFLASLYGHTGRHEEALQMWRELLKINPDFSVEHLRRVLPFRDPAWFDRFLGGLRNAGLPE